MFGSYSLIHIELQCQQANQLAIVITVVFSLQLRSSTLMQDENDLINIKMDKKTDVLPKLAVQFTLG